MKCSAKEECQEWMGRVTIEEVLDNQQKSYHGKYGWKTKRIDGSYDAVRRIVKTDHRRKRGEEEYWRETKIRIYSTDNKGPRMRVVRRNSKDSG